MVGTVVYIRPNAQYGESAQDTGLGSFLDTSADCGDIFLRNRTADNGGGELEGFLGIGFHGSEVHFTVTILSTSAGLLRVLAVHVNRLGKGLFVRNLRCAHVGLYVELTQQTVYDDIQMQLAHTGDDGLASLLVRADAEGRIFLCQLDQSVAHLVLAGLGLGLDCDVDNRLRELHGLQDNGILLITDRIAGTGDLEANRGSDIAGVNLVQLISLVGVHLKDTSNTLLLALCCIQYIGTGVQAS